MVSAPSTPLPAPAALRAGERVRSRLASLRLPKPELAALVALAAVLNLWALSRNGFANEYYSAAVRSMSTSWHDFLFASNDPSGVMTVDKPPLALWIQALSVRVFGYHSLSILVPDALIGVATVALVYDLVRRRFGRLAGFVAGLVLATTPIAVAMSRHNNPDALLALCCVGALWFTARALEDGRTRWIVLAGVAVGLGFETKMAAALLVVPAIVAAWVWVAPRGRAQALRALAAGGAALVAVGGAWPLLVALTPAADRPWISGTSDNSILSLIFGYNGVGRLAGQAGGPAATGGPGGPGGAGGVFGGSPGVLRLLDNALGGQAGWLLGFALVSGIGLLVATRLRRTHPDTGWLLAVGGSLLTMAVAFSVADGIFHPYYVEQLAPFEAALVGAGVGIALRAEVGWGRFAGALALAGGVVTEVIVLHNAPGQLTWLPTVLIPAGIGAAVVLAFATRLRVQVAVLLAGLALLLFAPASWAVQTLGHATSGTFPAGGPASAGVGIGPGRPGGPFGGGGRGGFGRPGVGRFGAAPQLFGNGSSSASAAPPAGGPGAGGFGLFGGGGFGGAGGFGGGDDLSPALDYAAAHGGGTLAVSSQSTASTAIVADGANVAGIGGFSGNESDVSISWLAMEVRDGHIRWVLADDGFGGGFSGGRIGATKALAAVRAACTAVPSVSGLYDCAGRSPELLTTGAAAAAAAS